MTPPPGCPPDALLCLSLLGGFQARVADGPVLQQGYAKLRGLLARLALAGGRPLARDELADLLWPDMPMAAARQNLRRALFNLKAALGAAGALLQARREEVVLEAGGCRLDVDAFRAPLPAGDAVAVAAMEAQAALYHGPLLAGLEIPSPAFEDWLAPMRHALHGEALALLERLAERHEAAGQPQRALPWARRHLELEPWLESAHRRMMRLHALAGQPAAALAQYETCRRVLATELGAVPDAETEALRAALAAGTFSAAASPAASESPQRRQVTVLCGELVAPGARDPEEALERLHAPHARWLAAIRAQGGHLVHLHGAAALAYFGYPRAQEHAARRAVEAALAAREQDDPGVVLHAGLHTGVVVTGDDPGRPDPAGAVSARAFALRQLAGAGEIVLSAETGEQVAGYFALGPAAGDEGTPHRCVLGRTGATHRLAAARHLSPFVGRARELAQLRQHWDAARGGANRVLLVRGEAGVGKSRLVHEFLQGLGAPVHAMRCFAESQPAALYPVAALLETLCAPPQGTPDEGAADEGAGQRHVSEALAARAAGLAGGRHWPLLAQMLSLPWPEPPAQARALSAAQRQAAFALLAEWLAALLHGTPAAPALLVIEDAHWLDASSLEFLAHLWARPGPLLALVTARPGFAGPWPGVPALDLGALDDPSIARLVRALAPHLAPACVDDVVGHADGVALFAEEILRSRAGGGRGAVPPTLADLLAARLDRQREARRTLQLAATLGREFDLSLLAAMGALAAPALERELRQLHEAGLLEPLAAGRWRFRHALLLAAAYESQTRADRRAAHRAAADALLRAQPGLAARRPELLARHFGGAGETERAARCWIDAGQRSLRDLACADAMQQFEAGLATVTELGAGAARGRLECALWQGVGVCAHLSEGFGSARADAAFDRAMALASELGERGATFQALWGLWQGASSRPGTSEATTLARRLLALSERGEEALQQQAHYALGNGLLYRGELAAAATHLERSIALEGAGASTLDGHGRVTAVTSRSYLAWTRWLQGRGAEALPWLEASLRRAREHEAPDTLAMALAFAAVLRGWRGEYAASHALAAEGHALARQHGLAVPMLANGMAAAWAEVHLGDAEGLARLERMVATVRVAMDGITASFLVPQAEAHLRLDDAPGAVALCEEALALMDSKGDRYYAAAAARVRGEALARLGRPAAAEAALADAIARAQAQGAAALALQAGLPLARLRLQQDGAVAARALLAPLRSAVDEVPGSPWLAPVEALLAGAD